jgi:GTP 3',8-cyclase
MPQRDPIDHSAARHHVAHEPGTTPHRRMTTHLPIQLAPAGAPLVDPFGRTIEYIRISVTDRCDFRCVYCMSEDMSFLPKRDLLTLEELDRIGAAFIARGTKKIRITGGEPLVRRDIMNLFRALGRRIGPGGLEELTVTTNGSQLARHAAELADCGVRRVNVSMDTLDPAKFRTITRWGDLGKVLDGVGAAKAAGLKVKINAVALKGVNEHEIEPMIRWAHGEGMDITFIEVMPLGDIEPARIDQFLPLSVVRARLMDTLTMTDDPHRTGGPARYVRVKETGGLLGFITPMTHNFCESCNRVRLTCTGTLYMCLGQEDAADLRSVIRSSESDEPLHRAIEAAIARKPKGHDFVIDRRVNRPAVGRHMSVTGG